MKVEVRFRGLEVSDALREHAVRQVHSHLSRFNGEIASVALRIGDINGPKGGVDKRCQVTIRGPVFSSVLIEELSGDAYSAVGAAVERAAHAVGRELARLRAARRGRASVDRPQAIARSHRRNARPHSPLLARQQ